MFCCGEYHVELGTEDHVIGNDNNWVGGGQSEGASERLAEG